MDKSPHHSTGKAMSKSRLSKRSEHQTGQGTREQEKGGPSTRKPAWVDDGLGDSWELGYASESFLTLLEKARVLLGTWAREVVRPP